MEYVTNVDIFFDVEDDSTPEDRDDVMRKLKVAIESTGASVDGFSEPELI